MKQIDINGYREEIIERYDFPIEKCKTILKNKVTLKFDDFYFKCSIGKNGLTTKKIEGDKRTPKGFFNIEHLYFRKDRIDKPKTINNIKQIKLAAGTHKFKDWPNWKKNFNSHEQYVSIHRWNWLIYEVSKPDTKVDHDWGINMVRSWFHDMGILPNGAASESYTLGERISNISLFTREMTGNWDQVPKDIKQAIKYMAEYLAYRLEYLPGNLTGNHIINNARALLFAGHVSGSDEMIVLSRRIL